MHLTATNLLQLANGLEDYTSRIDPTIDYELEVDSMRVVLGATTTVPSLIKYLKYLNSFGHVNTNHILDGHIHFNN